MGMRRRPIDRTAADVARSMSGGDDPATEEAAWIRSELVEAKIGHTYHAGPRTEWFTLHNPTERGQLWFLMYAPEWTWDSRSARYTRQIP